MIAPGNSQLKEYNFYHLQSFVLFREIGKSFPCPWHYHPEYELVLVVKSTGHHLVGDHIDYFKEGDLVLMGPLLPHVWVNDSQYINGKADPLAEAIVIHFEEDFLGENFLDIPEMVPVKNFLKLSNRELQLKLLPCRLLPDELLSMETNHHNILPIYPRGCCEPTVTQRFSLYNFCSKEVSKPNKTS